MARQVERIATDGAERTTAGGLLRRFDAPLGVALLTLMAYGLFIVVRLVSFGGDISRFVDAGDHFIPAAAARTVGLSVQPHAFGYDGQFYYLLALNPFSAHPALPGASFDLPAYRAQRILYPLLVWLLSLGGRPALVPVMLVVVNLAAIVAIGALGAKLAQRFGAAPRWGLLLAFYPGLLLSLARDLAEPLALACALGGVLCALHRPRPRWSWATLLLSLAVLARETTALVALALFVAGATSGAVAYFQRRAHSDGKKTPIACWRFPAGQWRGAMLAGATPLLVALGWQAVLLARWGKLGLLAAGGNNLGPPLVGLFEGFVAWHILWPPLLQAMQYADVAYLLALAELTRRLLWRERAVRKGSFLALAFVLAFALAFALALCLTVFVWDYYYNFLRGVIELATLCLLLLLNASPRARRIAAAATLALWLVTFLVSAPTS